MIEQRRTTSYAKKVRIFLHYDTKGVSWYSNASTSYVQALSRKPGHNTKWFSKSFGMESSSNCYVASSNEKISLASIAILTANVAGGLGNNEAIFAASIWLHLQVVRSQKNAKYSLEANCSYVVDESWWPPNNSFNNNLPADIPSLPITVRTTRFAFMIMSTPDVAQENLYWVNRWPFL
jgi:hypothetical protein